MTPNETYVAAMTLTELPEKHQAIARTLNASVPNQNDFRFAGLEAAENPTRRR